MATTPKSTSKKASTKPAKTGAKPVTQKTSKSAGKVAPKAVSKPASKAKAAPSKAPAKALKSRVDSNAAAAAAATVAATATASASAVSSVVGSAEKIKQGGLGCCACGGSRKLVLGLVVVLLLVAGAVVYWAKCQYKQGPAYALEELHQALVMQDVETVKKRVDVPAVATSVIRQVFVPQVEEATASGLAMLGNRFANSLAELVVPTLSGNLGREALNAVEAGNPQVADSLIFKRLWTSLAGETPGNLVFMGIENAQFDQALATADVRFNRQDYESEIVFSLQMKKTEEGIWQVMDINNFQQVLGTLQELRAAAIAAKNEKIKTQLTEAVQVVSTTLSKSIGGGEGVEAPTHILVQAAFQNNSGKAIAGFHAVASLSVNEVLVKTIEISEDELLPAGEVVEKSWPYGINPFSESEKALYNINPEEVEVRVDVVRVNFGDGSSLALIRE